MTRHIVTLPAALLRRPTTPVDDPTAPEIRTLVQDLKDSCVAAHGVGIASTQIGDSRRVCVINYPQGKLFVLINPEVVFQSKGASVLEEACLSVPGRTVPVSRPKKVRVRALDDMGKPIEITADDFLAKVLQHEIDHLNGVLITDYQQS